MDHAPLGSYANGRKTGLPETGGSQWLYSRHCGLVPLAVQIRDRGGRLQVLIYTTARGDRLEKAISMTKEARVPILVDWAAGIPPVENLALPWKMGADLYTFSGGKGLCGPQCSGLLLGRKDLIEAALAQSCPWEGAVCRPMKVGKEEIMGVLAADIHQRSVVRDVHLG